MNVSENIISKLRSYADDKYYDALVIKAEK
jgi:hypothetical protein